MKASIIRKQLRPTMVYSEEDYDKIWKNFILVVIPLEDEFYYANKISKDKYKGQWEITGEGYIFSGPNYKEDSKIFINKKRNELRNKKISYYTDDLKLIK